MAEPAIPPYDQKVAIHAQMKWVIRDDLPFDMFDRTQWTQFIQQNVQPGYERVSKQTIKRLAFKYYIKAKKDLIAYFEIFQGKLSLTSHVWDTACIGLKFVAITCHWIDPETWKMSKRTICIQGHEDVHETIMDCVDDFGIKDKVFSFAEFLREKGVKFNDPGVNWPHMWNNVYKMLRCIVAQKALLVEFYVNCDDENDIEDSDWVIVESLLGILKVFHSSTVRLSNAKSPSAPLLLGECLLISDMLKKYKQDPFWQPVITKLQSVLLKYYKTIPPVFLCATALNPKIGVKGVENILEDIEANLGLSDDMNDNTFAKVSIAKFRSALQEVFDHYDSMHKSRPREQAPVKSTARNIIHQSVSRKRSANGTISSDLELYNKTDFSQVMTSDDEETKMLEWWSVKGCHLYPVLGEMVRDLLTVQAFVEDLEYAFCLKGRELDEETSMGYPWWLQRRIFLKEHFNEVGWEDNGELAEDLEGECESHNYDKLSDASDEE
ncbi:zinc finger BED domain-containing protein RICESLEEPER 2-like protein [Tanacetum coccineum]